jgi:hypothetical protein
MKQVLFPGNPSFWYETLRSFGHIAYGGADFGEVVVISGHITDGDYDSWPDEYLRAADRIAAEAEEALDAGHRVSARDGLLRAFNYHRSADFFLHGNPDDPRHYAAFYRSVECFEAVAGLFTPPVLAGAQRLAMARVCNWLDDTLGAPAATGQLTPASDKKT